MKLLVTAILASLAAAAATAASAAPLAVTSYDTPNGDGQVSGGSYNYWDRSYSGAGSTTTDGAPLTGGVGDLTDGVIAPGPWYAVENGGGTGPYVGWLGGATRNPVVGFHFAGAPVINDITVYLDNSQIGGVVAPAAILIDGEAVAFTAPPPGTIGAIVFTGLNLTGGFHTVEFDQPDTSSWAFVSEVSFDGTATGGVPEPAAWMMMIAGFGVVGAAARRRRFVVA